jgi:hypothetical protein
VSQVTAVPETGRLDGDDLGHDRAPSCRRTRPGKERMYECTYI